MYKRQSQECTVYGLQEGVSYPVVRQETVERESRKGKLYDDLNRCYTLQFTYGDQSKTYYFIMVPEDDMDQYRNVLRGNWEQSVRGYRYKYQDDYLKSWGLINGCLLYTSQYIMNDISVIYIKDVPNAVRTGTEAVSDGGREKVPVRQHIHAPFAAYVGAGYVRLRDH